MKQFLLAAAATTIGTVSAHAADYKFTATNMMDAGHRIAPLVIVDAANAESTMFDLGKMTELYTNTVLRGDPRPMNGKMPTAVYGAILGKSGPPGVQIDGGETASVDFYVVGSTLRFFAKGSYGEGEDTVISGVWDIAMGGGEVMLHRYDIGYSEGTGEITLVEENAVKLVITKN